MRRIGRGCGTKKETVVTKLTYSLPSPPVDYCVDVGSTGHVLLRKQPAPATPPPLQRPATADAADAIELRASAALHRAVALAPTDALHGNELGVFLHTAGRHPEAVLRFEAAIAADPLENHVLSHELEDEP